MDIKEIYDKVNKLTLGDKKKALAQLTPEQKKEFDKYNNKQRQAKYLNKLKHDDLTKYEEIKQIKNNNKKKLLENPDKKEEYKAKNINDVKKFRLNEKKKLEDIKKIQATNIIINALKTKKAKKQLQELKQNKQEQHIEIVKDILNDVISNIPIESDKDKKRRYMREWRAKQREKKGLPPVKPNVGRPRKYSPKI